MVFCIANSAFVCYNLSMNNYFEYNLTYNQIFFNYTNKAEIDEREIHTYNEILFYLGDDITFLTETFSKTIKRNTLIFIPKDKYHFLITAVLW